jgi:hypothetical protein
MAYYTALIAAWNSGTQPPAGVTGTALTGLTTANKIIAVNGWTIPATAQKAILTPSSILNAIVFADLAALTQLQVTQLTLLLQGSQVDASVGTSIRAGIQALFAGKTQTLNNLAALVAPFDNPTQPWWKAATGGALNGPVSQSDLTAAGGLS